MKNYYPFSPLFLIFVFAFTKPVLAQVIDPSFDNSGLGASLSIMPVQCSDMNAIRAPLGTAANDSVAGAVNGAISGGGLLGNFEVNDPCDSLDQSANTGTTGLAGAFNGLKNIRNRQAFSRQNPEKVTLNFQDFRFKEDQSVSTIADTTQPHLYSKGGAAGDYSSVFNDKLGVFVTGNFSFADRDRTSRQAGLDFDILGVTIGSDYRLKDEWVFGVAFDYAATNTDYDRGSGGLDSDQYGVSIYSSYNPREGFFVDGILRYGWTDYDLERKFLVGGARQTANADYDSIDYAASLSGGYEFTSNGFSFEPYARIDYVAVDIDSYQENGASGGVPLGVAIGIGGTPAAVGGGGLISVNQQNVQSLRTSLGGQASYTISSHYGVFIPTLRAEWIHEYKNNSRTIKATRSGILPTQFLLKTDNPDRNFFNLGAGLTGVFAYGISGFLYYEALLGNNFLSQHSVNLGIRTEF